jgi:predicted MFS family arabinose efflux permease
VNTLYLSVLVWWATKHNTPTGQLVERMDKKQIAGEDSFSFSQLATLFRDFDWAEFWDLFLVRFFAGFSMIIFRGNFTMVLKQKFDASPKTIGYITSYSGAVATLSGFVIGKITDRYNSTARLLLHVTILQVITLLCLTLSTSLHFIVLFLAPLSVVTSVSRVAGASLTISRSGNSKIGSVMGLSQSVTAVARMSAPFFAGVAQEFSIDGAAFIGVIAAAASVLVLLVRPQDPKIKHKVVQ